MRKEQACPFSLRAELIGIWNSVRRGTPPLSERLKGTVDNLRSAIRETQDQLAYSTFEYQEGVDGRGQPDLVHPRFGPMTDSLLRFIAIQNSSEGREVAKFQLRQWLLIKEAALELKDGEEIYTFIPKKIEIEDGVALMRLRKDGDHFLAQSRLLSQDFDQEKTSLLFEKFKEKGFKIKDLTSDEPSLIFRIAKGEKENAVDLKDDLPQMLTELSRPVLVQEVQENQIARPLIEFSPSTSFSLFEIVLLQEIVVASLQSKEMPHEKVILAIPNCLEKPQIDKIELSLNQPEISVTHKSSLHNLQRSQENVQTGVIKENVFVEENEEIPVKEEQALDMKQQEVALETTSRPTTRKEAITEASVGLHPGRVNREEVENSVTVDQLSEELQPERQVGRKTVPVERKEVVVFEAAAPVIEVTASVTEPFVFIREKPRIEEKTVSEIATLQLLQPVEERVLPVLVVPDFWQAEQTVRAEGEIFQSIVQEMIEKEVDRRERQKKIAGIREEGVVLPKTEVWAPKIVHRSVAKAMERRRLNLPLGLFSSEGNKTVPEVPKGLHLRGVRISDWGLEFRRKAPNWIELLTPKEIGIVTSIARDKFGINDPFSFPEMADSILFWLLGMSLFAPKPALYKLELGFTPLTVYKKGEKLLVARLVTPEIILEREGLLAEERRFPSRPALFLTT